MKLSKTERDVLERFAAYLPHAGSKWQVYGFTPGPAVDAAIHALRDAGLLAVAPGADGYGGTLLRVSGAGLAALGRAVPQPVRATNGKRTARRA